MRALTTLESWPGSRSGFNEGNAQSHTFASVPLALPAKGFTSILRVALLPLIIVGILLLTPCAGIQIQPIYLNCNPPDSINAVQEDGIVGITRYDFVWGTDIEPVWIYQVDRRIIRVGCRSHHLTRKWERAHGRLKERSDAFQRQIDELVTERAKVDEASMVLDGRIGGLVDAPNKWDIERRSKELLDANPDWDEREIPNRLMRNAIKNQSSLGEDDCVDTDELKEKLIDEVYQDY